MALIETISALAFVYALLAVIASAFKELLEAWVQKRKKDLKGAIEDLLSTEGAKAFFKLPMFSSINNTPTESSTAASHKHWPSYIDAKTFAIAIQQIVSQPQFKQFWDKSPLGMAVGSMSTDLPQQANAIESLYAQRMERVQGSFKRNAQAWLLGIGLILAVCMDADSIHLARQLGTDPTVRALVAGMADKSGVKTDGISTYCELPAGQVNAQKLNDCLTRSLPGVIGWTQERADKVSGSCRAALAALLGYLLTAIAVSLGAPFWFDLMGKVANLRSTVKPIAK